METPVNVFGSPSSRNARCRSPARSTRTMRCWRSGRGFARCIFQAAVSRRDRSVCPTLESSDWKMCW